MDEYADQALKSFEESFEASVKHFNDQLDREETFISEQEVVFDQAIFDCRRQFDETLFENLEVDDTHDQIHSHDHTQNNDHTHSHDHIETPIDN